MRLQILAPVLLSGLVLVGGSKLAGAASYDCAKAGTYQEHEICGDPALSKLDEQVSAFYKSAMTVVSDQAKLKSDQRAWLKSRNNCQDAPCIKASQQSRLSELVKITSATEAGSVQPSPGENIQLMPAAGSTQSQAPSPQPIVSKPILEEPASKQMAVVPSKVVAGEIKPTPASVEPEEYWPIAPTIIPGIKPPRKKESNERNDGLANPFLLDGLWGCTSSDYGTLSKRRYFGSYYETWAWDGSNHYVGKYKLSEGNVRQDTYTYSKTDKSKRWNTTSVIGMPSNRDLIERSTTTGLTLCVFEDE